MAMAALLALCGTAAAMGATRPAPGGGTSASASDASPRDAGARKERRCARLDHVLSGLERAKSHLEQKIKRVEGKIASGDLTPEQQARAKSFLDRLQKRQEKLGSLVARLQTRLDQNCSTND